MAAVSGGGTLANRLQPNDAKGKMLSASGQEVGLLASLSCSLPAPDIHSSSLPSEARWNG